MVLLFFLFAFLYLAAVVLFWSLCRMSGRQQKPWTLDEEFAMPESSNEHRVSYETQGTVLTMHPGRTIGV